jgi:ribosomal protein L1
MATIVSKRGGKRYEAAAAKIAPDKQYSLDEAVAVVKSMPATKFDQSVDLSFRLGVDPKHADQMVRGAVVLPHGIGKTVRVAVFAKGEKDREARDAGNVHTPIGKHSFGADQLAANGMALIEAIVRAKPAAAKGVYLRSLTLSTTMGPGVPVDAVAVANLFKKAV